MCVLRLPWPRAPPASNRLAGLRKPPLQNSMRLSARHLAQLGARVAVCRGERPSHGKAMDRAETPLRDGERSLDGLEQT